MRLLILAACVAIGLAGCAGGAMDEPLDEQPVSDGPTRAKARLVNAQGRFMATASLEQEESGVRVRLSASGMQQGTYAAHIHMVGRCDAPTFETAGGHWNPGAREHGRDNPDGAHQGDLPNLLVGTDGRGSIEFAVAGARLSGRDDILDLDGSAMMIHAQADDYRTDPSGNSGARIACGVIS